MNKKGKMLVVLACLALVVGVAVAQKNKPWNQWTLKEAESVLNNSGWGQTQAEITPPDTAPAWSNDSKKGGDAIDALNEDTGVHYYIRFLSAKPIRLAFLRLVELNPSQAIQQQIAAMRQFVDTEYKDVIVVGVDYFGKDVRYTEPAYKALITANIAGLKDVAYLVPKDGNRVNLIAYEPPVPGDPMGAKFTFPRTVNDKPVITAKTGEVRFYVQFPQLGVSASQITLNMRFKVSNFMYEGKLEF